MALTDKLTAIADAIRVQSGKTELIPLSQMPEEIINLQSLNFDVVGNPQPNNPKENTIWVDTDVPITSWVFSAKEPSTAESGMVWFPVGTSNTAAFNALKKNGIMVYPISAKQYIDGAWVAMTAKRHQGGDWVDLVTYLFNVGDLCEDITGGWTSSGWKYYSNQSGLNAAEIDDTIYLYGSSTSSASKCGILSTVNMIDLTDVSTIYAHNVASTTGGNTLFLMSSKTHIQGNYAAKLDLLASSNGADIALDVSSMKGSYYIVLASVGSSGYPSPSLEVSKVWWVK